MKAAGAVRCGEVVPRRRLLAARLRRWLSALVAALLLAAPAAADRHCFPALDGYFAARQQLLEGESCAPALAAAKAALEDAVANARICGCAALVELMEALRSELSGQERACEAAAAVVLDSEERAKDVVRLCHY